MNSMLFFLLESFLSEDMIEELHGFEENSLNIYNYNLKISHKEKMEEQVTYTSNK